MNLEAIEKIQNLALNASKVETDMATIALPRDVSIESLEKYMDTPYSFKGRFITNYIDAFAGYINKQDQSICFIQTDIMQADAFFDLGTTEEPGHGNHKASLKLSKTPAYARLCKLDDTTFSQRDLIEVLQDWRNYITPVDIDGESIDIKKAVGALQTIEIKAESASEHTETDFTASRSALDKIEANSKGTTKPVGFIFTCQPYSEFTQRDFYLPMSIITTRDKPMLKLRIEQFEDIQYQIAIEFENKLSDAIKDSVIHIGAFAK